eukprot:1159161-Pelagomonas_calceolata.AAC.5
MVLRTASSSMSSIGFQGMGPGNMQGGRMGPHPGGGGGGGGMMGGPGNMPRPSSLPGPPPGVPPSGLPGPPPIR